MEDLAVNTMKSFREWLGADSFMAGLSLGGSMVSDNAEDYYLTPYDLGYGHIVKFDREIIGRAALDAMAEKPYRQKRTLRRATDDVVKLFASQPGDRDRYKFIDMPASHFATCPHNLATKDDKPVGISHYPVYTSNVRSWISLALLDEDVVASGSEVSLTSGEPDGGSGKPAVERHTQTDVACLVEPCPMSVAARKDYKKQPLSATLCRRVQIWEKAMKLRTHAFQKNAWYAAAMAEEVTREPMRRIILNDPVVLFRTRDGEAVALEDRCCHRLAPLSAGRLLDDTIECPYHGLCFDKKGACTHIPGQVEVPEHAKVRAYAVIERYGMIWIWGGEESEADESSVPDWRWVEDDGWTTKGGYFNIPCHYMMSVDNLMDLSHVGYVHKTTIGSALDGEEAEIDTFATDEHVTVRRWTRNRPPPPAYAAKYGIEGQVDRWQIIEFRAPCHMRTFKGMGPDMYGADGFEFISAEADAPDHAKTVSRGNTCITPETETSCHYFTMHCYRGHLDEEQLNQIWDSTVETLNQDVVILTQTQENIGYNPDADLVFIHVDEGVEKARQLARMAVKKEQEA